MSVASDDLFALETISDLRLAPDGRCVAVVTSRIDRVADAYRCELSLVAEGGSEPVTGLSHPARLDAPRWSPDGGSLALLATEPGAVPRLVVISPGAASVPVTVAATGGGVSAFAWSPDGRYIAFVARTEGAGADAHPRLVHRIYHRAEGVGAVPDAGPGLFIVPAKGGPARRLADDVAGDQQPAWSPDGSRIAFVRRRSGVLDALHADLWCVSCSGADEAALAGIPSATAPAWSPDGGRIACFGSEPEALGPHGPVTRAWLVDAGGGRAARPVAPEVDSAAMLPRSGGVLPPPVWDRSGRSLTFQAAQRGDIHVVRIDTDSGRVASVVGGERQVFLGHACASARRVACVVSDALTPGDLRVFDWDGSGERCWRASNPAFRERAADLRVERRVFATSSGGEVEGWVFGSRAGDGAPRPLAVSVHGGPHGFVGNGFSASHFYRYVLAAQGWEVLALNAVGSVSYGEAFARAVVGGWGERDLPQHLDAAEALVREGRGDEGRMGIVGYSYGGYLAAFAVGQTDRFRAAVVGAPIANLESYFGTSDIGPWFCEWGLGGDPETLPELYRRLSPVSHTYRVTTPMLLLHGEADERCPIGQSEELFARLLHHGRAAEFVRYPAANHAFPGSGRPSHRFDFTSRVVDWLRRHVSQTSSRRFVEARTEGSRS